MLQRGREDCILLLNYSNNNQIQAKSYQVVVGTVKSRIVTLAIQSLSNTLWINLYNNEKDLSENEKKNHHNLRI
jgi:hypothetical protein